MNAILEVKNATQIFGGLIAVNDLSFHVGESEIVGMIGPNGAGKTTAMNIIAGVYKPNKGHIIFNGQEITNMRPDEICKQGLSRTFQVDKPFVGVTVLENVLIGAYNRTNNSRIALAKANEVLKFLNLEALADHNAGSLPIAFRRKLELARALATEPKMILLDEVMTGLRPLELDEMIEIVRRIRDMGIAILLVEHVMKVIMSLTDRIVVIHHGVKIAEDTPVNIVQNQTVVDAYLGEAYSNVTN